MTINVELYLALCALAGGLHVIAPDHWVPASIFTWQRGWSFERITGFSALLFGGHVLMGAVIYFVLREMIGDLSSQQLLIFSITLIAGVALMRGLRFRRIREVQSAGRESVWAIFSLISLLGPSEVIIPILIKAHQMGVGFLLPILVFFAGSLVGGLLLIVGGRVLWNRPDWLPRGIQWANRRVSAIPAATAVMVGLAFLLTV